VKIICSNRFRVYWLLTLLLSVNCLASEALDPKPRVHVVTEHFPPYNFINKDGEVDGLATQLVKKVLNKAGVDYDIQLMPFARAFKFVNEQKNYLIYTFGRTPEREAYFEWIGPASKPDHIWFYKLKSNKDTPLTPYCSLERFKPFTIAVANQTTYHKFLLNNGFYNLEPVVVYTQSFLMLKKGRVDMMFMSEKGFASFFERGDSVAELKRHNVRQEDFEKLMTPFSLTDYIAMNKDSDPDLVEAIRQAYNELLLNGEIEIQ